MSRHQNCRHARKGRSDAKRRWQRDAYHENHWKTDGDYDFAQIRRMCVDKARFSDESTVRRAARDMGLHYYRCPFCGQWHLTSRARGNRS